MRSEEIDMMLLRQEHPDKRSPKTWVKVMEKKGINVREKAKLRVVIGLAPKLSN
jgi:hypothetical protein